MMLYNTLKLKEALERERKHLAYLVAIKGISDLDVITVSQNLDQKVLEIQKVIGNLQNRKQQENLY